MYMISDTLFIIHPFKALRYEFLYHNLDDTDGIVKFNFKFVLII